MRDIINNSPTIRFPDFKEVWTTREFKDLVKRSSDKINTDSLSNFKCIELDSIEKHSGRLLKIYDQNTSFRSVKNMFETNDVLVGKLRPKLRKFYYATFDGCCSTEIWVFKSLGSISKFIYYLIQTPKFQQISTVTFGSKMPRSDWYYISEYPFFLPSLPEQQKIADFLTIVDKKIQALEKKKGLLEQYKKGLMQKVFKQEIRFKQEDGSDYPEWEEKRLGDIVTFSKGKGISKSDIELEATNPCIRYGELYTQYGEVIDNIVSHTNLQKEGLVLSEANDVIIPSSGETNIDIATASCVLYDGIILGGDLNIIKSKMNGVFLAYYMNSHLRLEIAKYGQGVSVVHLYSSHLKLLKLLVPSLNEQNKIANSLSAIDDKISVVTSQINKKKEWKKGLLQQMFV